MRAIRRKIRWDGRRGFVLIAVLVIVLLLAVMLMEFSHETNLALDVSGNSCSGEQARNCAEAGIAIALAAVRQYADPLQEGTLQPLLNAQTPIPVGGGTCTITLSDVDGRLNINRLKNAANEIDRPIVERMLRLVDALNAEEGREIPISYGVVAAMIDWADPGDDVTILDWVTGDNEGAKNDYYQSLTPPYLCKNAPFDSLDELLMVKDMTPEILYGRPGDDAAEIKPLDGMRDCLTIYGDGLIDLNYAPALVLQAVSPQITSDVAQLIVQRRTGVPFQSVQELGLIPGITPATYNAINGFFVVSPKKRHYSILSVGTVNGIEVKVQVMVRQEGVNNDPVLLYRKEL